MEEEDAAADPYLPYDGGGDTIPLQEIPRRGTPHPLLPSCSLPCRLLLLQRMHVTIWQQDSAG